MPRIVQVNFLLAKVTGSFINSTCNARRILSTTGRSFLSLLCPSIWEGAAFNYKNMYACSCSRHIHCLDERRQLEWQGKAVHKRRRSFPQETLPTFPHPQTEPNISCPHYRPASQQKQNRYSVSQPSSVRRKDRMLSSTSVFHLFILTGGRSVVVTKPQLEVGGNLIAINSVRLVVTTLLKIPYAIWIPIYFATLWGRSPNSSRVIYNVNFLLGTPSLFLLTPKPRNQARVTNKYSRIMSVIASLIKCSETSFQFVGVTYEEGPRTGFQGACEEIYQLFNTFCHHQLTLGHPFSTNCLRVSPHSSFRG